VHHHIDGAQDKTIEAAEPQQVIYSKQKNVSINRHHQKLQIRADQILSYSSISNAANSPFLVLPPELRHRIYGYTLGNRVIHIFERLVDRNTTHHLAVCTNPPVDDRNECRKHVYDREQYPRLNLSEIGLHFTIVPTRDGHEIIKSDDHPHNQCMLQSSKVRLQLPLQFLQVCRQIYGEAVLIPFARNAFIASAEYRENGLRALLATLVPVQIRAIAHLVLLTYDDRYLKYSSSAKLEGLK